MAEYPDNNPKTLVGASKVPLHLVPPSAKHYLALALKDGAGKYGPYNWRDSKISVSTYKAAAERHLDAYWDGEELAPDSKVHHLAHAMACLALILDAKDIDMLVDDRPTKGASPRLQNEYSEPQKLRSSSEMLKMADEYCKRWEDRIEQAVTNDGWIPWNGGENPVPGKVVWVRCRDGYQSDSLPSDEVWWDRHEAIWDVVAYKVVG